MIFVLTINGKEHMKGKEETLKSYVARFNILDYLIISLDAHRKIKLSQKTQHIMSSWKWGKIPVEDYPKVRRLIENQQFSSLLRIHNGNGVYANRLSDNEYCCGTAVTETMFNQFKRQYLRGYFDETKAADGLQQ